jgi:hypothetical protein
MNRYMGNYGLYMSALLEVADGPYMGESMPCVFGTTWWTFLTKSMMSG